MSISPAPIPWSAAATFTSPARTWASISPRKHAVEADVVVPVPDGGTPAAIGYAQASGIPFELGIIRNHYVGRTFIEPTQQIRAFGVKLKHSANRAIIEGKRVVLVDDSIVRGTTSVKIVQMIRDAGAREVHIRVASPMIYHPDFYGIDTPDADKLLANQYSSLEGNVRFHRCRFAGIPVDRRPLPRRWRSLARQCSSRNSPTIISPATIRPVCSTGKAAPAMSASSPCLPAMADRGLSPLFS